MKVAVAMSGGVDSSAALIKLIDKGYDCIGVTIKPFCDEETCCKLCSIKDAKYICDMFNIKHYTINLDKIFNELIVSYFVNDYLKGRTPNPCLYCNPLVKFSKIFEFANQLGYDHISTGHYANIVNIDGEFFIKKGKYLNKEQSYFLSRLPKEMLQYIIFPLGDTSKQENRDYLKERNIPFFDKGESQEVCFIPNDDYKEFVRKRSNGKYSKGIIQHIDGEILGEHIGIPFYTIGQRKGLGIAYKTPLYVREIIPEKNLIIVGPQILSDSFYVSDVVYFKEYDYLKYRELNVKVRYRAIGEKCKITRIDDEKLFVKLNNKIQSITKGQGAVFYLDDIVVASSIIENIIE